MIHDRASWRTRMRLAALVVTAAVLPLASLGGSAVQAIKLVQANKPADMGLVCIVCAPEGVRAVEEIDPEINIVAAALDRELNTRKYILPGLGDFGDRLYGT